MNAILIFHSLLRWAVLLFGLWAIVNAIGGMSKKREYSAGDKRTGLFFMISCDIQLLLGLILYFNGMWFNLLKTNAKEVMKDGPSRFFAMEHILMMVIAWLIGAHRMEHGQTCGNQHRETQEKPGLVRYRPPDHPGHDPLAFPPVGYCP
ncbi:MAG: cytochrome B [Chitinophagaceae bacterium]|nr:cytochrome B [Chitinophagaceae bacterium]